jgi:hypothetical protein
MLTEDSMIMDIEANLTDLSLTGKVRLKYLAISGGCGPEIIMDRSLAIKTIEQLKNVLQQEPLSDDGIACIYPIGLTTCGYTKVKHFRYDGKPLNHEFLALED